MRHSCPTHTPPPRNTQKKIAFALPLCASLSENKPNSPYSAIHMMTNGSEGPNVQVRLINVRIMVVVLFCCVTERIYVLRVQAAFDRKSFSNIVYYPVGSFLMNTANSVDKYSCFYPRCTYSES